MQEATKKRHGMHALQMGWHELNTTLGECLPSTVELVNCAKWVDGIAFGKAEVGHLVLIIVVNL